jgi:hypothetical protein
MTVADFYNNGNAVNSIEYGPEEFVYSGGRGG